VSEHLKDPLQLWPWWLWNDTCKLTAAGGSSNVMSTAQAVTQWT